MTRRFLALTLHRTGPLLLLFLGACATQQATVETPPPVIEVTPPLVEPPIVVTPVPPPVVRPQVQPPPPGGYPRNVQTSGAGPAVISLFKQAQESRGAGKFDVALGQLERALRIEPRNAFLWQSLAETHLQLQNAEQAESAAQKSTSLARGNPYLEAGNWRLIAAARQARGDSVGAQHATVRAEEITRESFATP